MCSVTEDNVGPEMVPAPKLSLCGAVCRKCQEAKAQVLLRKTDPYCSACFMAYACHKFRSTIGKYRAARPKDLILLAYSGGLSSGSMLKLVCDGIEEAGLQKRMVFKPTVLYIDEGAILELTDADRRTSAESILQLSRQCGFDAYTTSLEYSLVADPEDIRLHFNNYEIANGSQLHQDQLVNLFSSVKSLTAKEDLLLRLRNELIAKCALRLNHFKVFLGLTATRLASQLLTAVAQGRGAQISDEIGFCDARNEVEFFRPMREFVDKEVAYLAKFLNVDSVSIPSLSTKLGPNASIGRLTEEFVVRLQNDFPSTISTLFRTGDKLSSNAVSSECDKDSLCLLCHSKIEEMAECSAFSARTFSQSISRCKPGEMPQSALHHSASNCQSDDSCTSGCSDSLKTCCKLANKAPTKMQWTAVLCYGCRVTLEDVAKAEYMPETMKEEIQQRTRREKMRRSVEQFLL